jgi:hypothetical protein
MQNRRADIEQRFVRKLGAENLWFEEFDLGTQLGAIYTNPVTGRRAAVHVYPDCDPAHVDAVIRRMIEVTQAQQEGKVSAMDG